MDWTDAGLKDHIKNWLEAVAEERYVRDRRLDPFATSMRDFDDVSPNLKEIRQGGALSLNDPAQRVTDLRAAGLISDDGKTLSPFGEATLAAWENYGVDSDAKSDELARLLLYALEGQRVGDGQVLSFLAYWKDLRTYFDPHKLIENWDALYSLNYLDFARKGFYPGAAYRDGSVPVSEIEFDLVDYSDASGLGPKATEGAVKVQNAIGGKVPRGRHRSTLAMALEIVVSGSVSDTILNNFGIPKTPRTWASFNDSQKEKVLAIASDYQIAGTAAKGAAPVAVAGVAKPDRAKPALPAGIDYSKVLVASPKGVARSAAPEPGNKPPKKVDHLKKAERDSHVGKLGEEFAIGYEKWRLREHPELLKKLRHVSQDDDSLGYDIESFELDGTPRYIEVKGTLGPLVTRFFLSANENKVAVEKGKQYLVLRIGNLDTEPTCCEIRHPFENLSLTPATFEVTFLP